MEQRKSIKAKERTPEVLFPLYLRFHASKCTSSYYNKSVTLKRLKRPLTSLLPSFCVVNCKLKKKKRKNISLPHLVNFTFSSKERIITLRNDSS